MKNNLTLLAREGKAKASQNTGEGASQQSTAQHDSARVFKYFNTQMAWFLWNKKGEATVSKSSCSGAEGSVTMAETTNHHSLSIHSASIEHPLSIHSASIWRRWETGKKQFAKVYKYVACLLLVLFVGVGNVWGDVTYDLTGYSTQITNGWTHDYGDIYVGRKGSNYTPVEGGLPTGNSNIFAAFQVTESSSIRVVFVWTKTNGDLSGKQIDLASINKATYDKLALASTGTGNDVKYSIDNFSSSQYSAVAINRSDANKDINIDFETTVSAGYYAVYTASSINASALIKKIIVTPAPSCSAPTTPTNGASTSSSRVVSWTAPGSAPAGGYLVAYSSATSTAPGDAVQAAGTNGNYTVVAVAAGTTTATLSALSASTTYNWWVRSKCGGSSFSSWVAGTAFTTAPPCGSTAQAALSLSSSSGTICGTGTTTFTVSGGSGDGALSVATSDASKATASIDGTTVTVTGVAAGSATITVTKACDATYAEKTATYTATVAAVPTANAGADKTTESGTGVALAATAAADGCTGAWTIVSGPSTSSSQLNSTSSATATFTPTAAGTYTLRWTVTNSTSGCSAYDEMTVKAAICSISDCGNATLTYPLNVGTSLVNTAANLVNTPSNGGSAALTVPAASAAVTLSTITISEKDGKNDNNGKAAAATNACYPTAPTMSSKIGMFNGEAYSSSNYLQFAFTVNSGYTFTPCDIQFTVQPVSNEASFRWEVTDGTNIYGYGTGNAPVGSGNGATVLTGLTSTSEMEAGDYYIRLYPYYNGSNTFRISNNVILKGTTAEVTPASGYAITKSATNGTIVVTDGSDAITSAEAGNDVYIAATPATGYGFTSWSVYKTGDAETTVTLANDDDTDNKTRKFTMPAYAVTVGATFTAINYTVTHSAATGGSYTIKVGDAEVVSTNTTAKYGQTVTLAASPNPGYGFSGWTVMQGETPVSVTNNTFTMPAGNVTVSAAFAQEPNVYYYKSASHYDGSAYKNPEGNAHDVALSNPWTILSGGTIAGVTSVVANGATFDDKSNDTEKWVTSYIKLSKDDASQNITFTIASGYLATIKMKIGAWSSTPTIYLKKGSDVQTYTGTIGGVATTENNFNELTWSDLSAGVYVLNVANEGNKKNAYISQIDIQTTPVYTLTYDANGGTGTMDNTVGTGTVTLSTNTYTKSGCTFQGWATSQANANAGTVAYADGATNYNLSADATLYAVWKLNAPTISCAANVVTMSAMSGAAIYYTTDGETTPTSSSTLYNSSSKPQIAANTTFKAIAILENYVSSDVTTQTCEYVAPATVDDLVTIDADYTFTPSADIAANTLTADSKFLAAGEGCTFNNGLLVKENRALAFKVNNGAKVKVTFTEKSDESTPREMQLGTAASDDDNKVYGHSGSSPVIFTVTADGVVYLTASKDLRFSTLEISYPHTVTYALGDGSGTLPTEGSHYKGDKFNVHDGVTGITAPANYGFSAWSDGTSTYAGGAQYTMGSANVTLTAQWAPLYSVTYVKAGTEEGTVPSQVSLPDGAQFTVANQGSLVTPANKVFGGWNDGTSTYAAGDTYTIDGENVTLTAVWNDSYTVEYDANGGTGTMADGTGATVTIAANGFTYDNHKFLRWNTKSDGEGNDYAVGAEVSESLTLYAIWKEVSCSASGVIFSLAMKTGLANESVDHGQELPLTSEYATITGGEATLRNNDGSGDDKAQIYKSEVYFNGANAYLKVDMDCGPLAVGDEIVVTSENYENELYLTNTNNTSEKIETVSRSYTIVANDLLEGKSIFYIWRKSGGTSVGTITITRPAPDAPVPTISNATPADAEYTGAASPMTVSADAEAPKDLHYQWYKEAGETDIEVGTDAASYTPVASGDYYCVVTNSPTGYAPQSATSRTATITMISSDATLAWLKADGNDIALSDGVYAYEYVIADAATVAPTITAGKNEEHASVTITQADSKTGTATVHVVAEDGETSHDYTVKFNEFSGCLTTFYFAKSADATDNGVVNNAPVRGYTVFTDVQSDGSSYGGTLTVNDVDYTATKSTSSKSSFGKLVVPAKYSATLYLLVRIGSSNTSLQLVKEGESTPYMSSDVYAEEGTYQYNFENVQAGTYVIRAWRNGSVQNCNYIAMAAELCRYEVSSVSLADMTLRTGESAAPVMTITPAKGAVVSQAWSFVDATAAEAAGLSINATTGVVSAEAEATPGAYAVKVVLNGDNSLSATCTVTVITEYSQSNVTGTTIWDFAAGKAAAAKITIGYGDKVLANVAGVTNDETFNSQALIVDANYVSNTQLQANSIMFHTTVPGLLTVRYGCTSGKDADRVLYINGRATTSKTKATDVEEYTQAVQAGDITIKAMYDDGGTPTVDIMNYKYIKFDTDLDPTQAVESTLGGYERDVTQGYYGTICLPNGGIMTGAMLFELAYFDETQQKIFFDEILNGVMVAGTPYIFLPKEGASQLGVYYTDAANAPAGDANGLYGSYAEAQLDADAGNYILYNNKYYFVNSGNVWVGANRAYIKLAEATPVSSPALAPKPKAGCRRISMGAYSEQTATGIGNVQGDQVQNTKMIIDGQLFIICGDKMYDATGKQVK